MDNQKREAVQAAVDDSIAKDKKAVVFHDQRTTGGFIVSTRDKRGFTPDEIVDIDRMIAGADLRVAEIADTDIVSTIWLVPTTRDVFRKSYPRPKGAAKPGE